MKVIEEKIKEYICKKLFEYVIAHLKKNINSFNSFYKRERVTYKDIFGYDEKYIDKMEFRTKLYNNIVKGFDKRVFNYLRNNKIISLK